jgi:diguanylate cyclase (GGDEF)-like protein/PAS domain S-box-containing protein
VNYKSFLSSSYDTKKPRAFLAFGSLLLYVLARILLPEDYGDIIALTAVVPGIVYGWFFGPRGGLSAGVIILLINFTYSHFTNQHLLHALFNSGVIILISLFIGRLKDLVNRITEQSQGLENEIAERERVENKLKISEERYKDLIEKAGLAILVDDIRGRLRYCNNRTAELFGYSLEELKALPNLSLVYPDDRYKVMRYHEMRINGEEVPTRYEFRGVKKDGTMLYLEVDAVRLEEKGRVNGTRSYIWDITQRKKAEIELQRMAKHDSLTSLPNRALFYEHLNAAISLGKRQNLKVFVLFMDLDGFKSINDTLGHELGDLLLVKVAQRMKDCTRDSDLVARLGGDEFTLILQNISKLRFADSVVEKIISNLLKPYDLDGNETSISASIGISYFPQDGDDSETLVQKADKAMYFVKSEGKNGYKFYTPEMQTSSTPSGPRNDWQDDFLV